MPETNVAVIAAAARRREDKLRVGEAMGPVRRAMEDFGNVIYRDPEYQRETRRRMAEAIVGVLELDTHEAKVSAVSSILEANQLVAEELARRGR
jgi:hypothetical protein